jgi:hypothetical protein
VFFEKEVLLKKKQYIFFFYSTNLVRNAVFLDIQKCCVKIQNFVEKNHRFYIDNIPPPPIG